MNMLYFAILTLLKAISVNSTNGPDWHEGHPYPENSLLRFLLEYEEPSLKKMRNEKKDEGFIIDPKQKKNKKRIYKRQYNKMTEKIYNEILEYERKHPDIKRTELEKIFNINRTTYWAWKKRYPKRGQIIQMLNDKE